MTIVDGLSFGVLKEQEFKFKSKLSCGSGRNRSHSLPQQLPPSDIKKELPKVSCSYSSNNCKRRGSSQVPDFGVPRLNTINEELCSDVQQEERSALPRPMDSKTSSTANKDSCCLRFTVPSTMPSSAADNGHLWNLANIASQRDSMQMHMNSHSVANLAYRGRDPTYASVTSYSNRTSRHSSFTAMGTSRSSGHLAARFNRQHAAQFTSGDPQSDRLAEFVSKMVYYIFWQGSDSYEILLHHGRIPSSFSSYSPDCEATDDFIYYTKCLLETMQVSCSTALLSLFYLHRLRPRVKQLFVPGTFNSTSSQEDSSDIPAKFQYRRDPKLEYRLFTIALILANKYLDDNSYSNKAWSDVTGLDLRKINIMELEFMKYIDYTLLVKEKEYVVWVRWLELFIKEVMQSYCKTSLLR